MGGGEVFVRLLILGLLALVIALQKVPRKVVSPLGVSLIEGNFTRLRPLAAGVPTCDLT